MLVRGLLLKVMLAALAAATLLGVSAVFLHSDAAWRLLGTAAIVAVMCGLLMPVAPGDQTRRMSAFGRVFGGYVVGCALVVGAVVWIDDPGLWETALATMAIWFAVGTPALLAATPALRNRAKADRSMALAEMIAIAGAIASLCLACGAWVFVQGSLFSVSSPIAIGLSLLWATVLAALSAIGLRGVSSARAMAPTPASREDRILGCAGITLAAAAAVAVQVPLWEAMLTPSAWGPSAPRYNVMGLIFVIASGLALPCAVWCTLGLSRDRSPLRYMRHAATVSNLMLGVFASVVAWDAYTEPSGPNPFTAQLAWATAILASTTLLAGVVLMRIHRAKPLHHTMIEMFAWRCPRCDSRSSFRPGESACTACGLTVFVHFRDDRCPACAYDLRGAPAGAANCPECGRERQMPSYAPQ